MRPIATVQRVLAAPAGFGAPDFDLLVNYRALLPPAPRVVETLLRHPAAVDSLLPALRRTLADTTAAGFVRAAPLWSWLDVVPASDAVAPVVASGGGEATGAVLTRAAQRIAAYAGALSPDAVAFLVRETPSLFRPGVEDTLLDPVAREVERLRGAAVTDSLMQLAARLPQQELAAATRDFDAALSSLLVIIRRDGVAAARAHLAALRDDHALPVRFGTAGNDVHRLDRGIVFDPGGDDRYEFPEAARPGDWLLLIDVAGQDVYVARDTTGGAAAFFAAQVIADLAGNDRYEGSDFAFGTALYGFARLYDAAGNDVYTGRAASLGFGFRGIGLVEDRAGDDTYSAAYLSQGASSSFGFGLLVDHAGNDRYEMRPVYLDDLRYRDRFLTLGQGFSTGLAPRYGGGLALLHDRAGDDAYTADIFGQGTGYWFGWGVLLEDSGDDAYRAHQYAQGAGVHFAVGTLVDAAGDDVRVSKGVSQGCGHDGAFGLFVDAAGNDSATAVDMSLGAGSANGLGIYLDIAGDDVYRAGNPAMTLGHADMRRDRGSFGFFLDPAGRDSLPAGFGRGDVRRVYDGKMRGEGYGAGDVNRGIDE